MMDPVDQQLDTWMAALEARLLSDLTFQEVSRALRALSSTYVERRQRLGDGAALSGAGKRAAFALFYGPLHFLLVRHIVSSLGHPFTGVNEVVDLGCGTGASGAGWVAACDRAPRLVGIDRHPWAIEEARRTTRDLGLGATLRVDDFTQASASRPSASRRRSSEAGVRPARTGDRSRAGGVVQRFVTGRPSRTGVLLAFAVNEVQQAEVRGTLLAGLLDHAAAGGHVIVLEPLAGFVAPWWPEWQRAFEAAGGRADQWRAAIPLPPIVDKLDRAAGLNHRELKGRSLSL